MAGGASCFWGPSFSQRLHKVVIGSSEAVMDARSSLLPSPFPSPLLTACPKVSHGAGRGLVPLVLPLLLAPGGPAVWLC